MLAVPPVSGVGCSSPHPEPSRQAGTVLPEVTAGSDRGIVIAVMGVTGKIQRVQNLQKWTKMGDRRR